MHLLLTVHTLGVHIVNPTLESGPHNSCTANEQSMLFVIKQIEKRNQKEGSESNIKQFGSLREWVCKLRQVDFRVIPGDSGTTKVCGSLYGQRRK